MESTDHTLMTERPDYQVSMTIARGLINGAILSFGFWVISACVFFGAGFLVGWFN